jgi:hypothetical protein
LKTGFAGKRKAWHTALARRTDEALEQTIATHLKVSYPFFVPFYTPQFHAAKPNRGFHRAGIAPAHCLRSHMFTPAVLSNRKTRTCRGVRMH